MVGTGMRITALVALVLLAPAAHATKLRGGFPSFFKKRKAGGKHHVNQCGKLYTPMMCNSTKTQGWSSSLVVSTYMEDLTWLNQMYFDGNIIVYVHDRSEDRSHKSKEEFGDDLEFAEQSEVEVRAANAGRKYPIQFETIPNKGDEAAAYLAYIIKKYYKLPDVVFFVQGHRCAQHAEFDMAKALPNIKECFPYDKGYLDLNTYFRKKPPQYPTCRDAVTLIDHPIRGFHLEHFKDLWTNLFQPEFGPMPGRICWDGYAQFGVRKEFILRHSLDFYKRLFQAVQRGDTTMEFFWKMLFLKEAITAPPDKSEERYDAMVEYIMQRR